MWYGNNETVTISFSSFSLSLSLSPPLFLLSLSPSPSLSPSLSLPPPLQILDDGGDATCLMLQKYPGAAKYTKGVVEESITGIHR